MISSHILNVAEVLFSSVYEYEGFSVFECGLKHYLYINILQ